jgi:hypothetical protein
MMLMVAGVALVAALLIGMNAVPVFFVPAAQPSRWSKADHEIYDIVLADLIDNPEFNFSIAGPGPRKTQIVFHTLAQNRIRVFSSASAWNGQQPDGALADVFERNPEGKQFSLFDYQPTNPNIIVAILDRSELKTGTLPRFPKACGFVIPYLPGYTRDGKTALFYFTPPRLGDHSGWGYYLLKKIDSGWVISQRFVDWAF